MNYVLKWIIHLSYYIRDNLGKEVFHSKTKHVALDLHFVRERVEEKLLIVEHISNKLQRTHWGWGGILVCTRWL